MKLCFVAEGVDPAQRVADRIRSDPLRLLGRPQDDVRVVTHNDCLSCSFHVLGSDHLAPHLPCRVVDQVVLVPTTCVTGDRWRASESFHNQHSKFHLWHCVYTIGLLPRTQSYAEDAEEEVDLDLLVPLTRVRPHTAARKPLCRIGFGRTAPTTRCCLLVGRWGRRFPAGIDSMGENGGGTRSADSRHTPSHD